MRLAVFVFLPFVAHSQTFESDVVPILKSKCYACHNESLKTKDLSLASLDGVFKGGESGPGARDMRATWVRSIRKQCRAVSVPFFFKQWGGVFKKAAGRELDGRTYDEFPVVPLVLVPA